VGCRVVNFGSPKVGNQEFESSVYASVGRIYRVVNSNDAVSTTWLYTHMGMYIFGHASSLSKSQT